MANLFFREKQPAAVLKHELLRRYLPVFVSATGRTSPGNRVVYFDGFAGTGAYDSGEPGSPLLAATTASYFKKRGLRNLKCHYAEADPGRYEKLKVSLATIDHDYEIHPGTAASAIDRVLDDSRDLPLFAFLDPFGLLGIPFEELVSRILARPIYSPTELLLNFSVATLRRRIGHVRGDHSTAKNRKAIETIIERTDLSLGGKWWREIATSMIEGADREIYKVYRARLQQNAAIGWCSVPVRPRLDLRPLYYLLYFSRHPLGHWEFNDCSSYAWEHYVRACLRGQGELFNPKAEIESRLYEHLKSPLAAGRTVRLGRNLTETFGPVMGIGRDMHLRSAIKRLYREGLTGFNGVGELRGQSLSPASPAAR